MPEGDTLHRTAARLRPALVGAGLVRFELARVPRPHPALGTVVLDVRAVGKHLLIDLDGWVLRTHLRMSGSWHLYETGQRWQRPAHLARAVLGVPGWEAVCFAAPVVVLERTARSGRGTPGRSNAEGAVGRSPGAEGAVDRAPGAEASVDRSPGAEGSADGAPVGEGTGRSAVPPPAAAVPAAQPAALAHLGPDLCVAGADLDRAVDRMAAIPAPETTVAEVLLDQRVAAGIGNVYKSEVLWACRVDPFTPIERVDGATRRRLVDRAHRLLLANLGGGPRTTVPGPPGSLAVYGRAGRPCPRCGTPISSRRHGEQARRTFWCPRCQAPSA